jgi:hypothetical protein
MAARIYDLFDSSVPATIASVLDWPKASENSTFRGFLIHSELPRVSVT